jgi:uncharacterized protein YigA (DUF484 family)
MSETMEQARLTEKQEQTIVNFLSANPDFFERHPELLAPAKNVEETAVEYISSNPDFFERYPELRQQEDNLKESVAEYLRSNPDFLDKRPELLNELVLTHENGEAVSLIERQVKTLRQELDESKLRLGELMAIGHDNERLNKRMHLLTLNLIDTVDFDECLNVLQDKLHDDFDADAVELHLFTHNEVDGLSNADLDGYRDFLDSGSPTCGIIDMEQLKYLFGPQAEDIKSTALIPIKSEGVLGVLAIGSSSETRFCSDMGTEYLQRLGEIISRKLEVVLEPGF